MKWPKICWPFMENRAPYLTSTSPPSFLLFPFHLPPFLLSYIVINQTILLSSVMCLYVQRGNERILSPSSAGFDSACRSNTHFHHPLTMPGLCCCVCMCSSVVDKERFVRAALLILPLDSATQWVNHCHTIMVKWTMCLFIMSHLYCVYTPRCCSH